eukprot:m.110413 g.110413  ORF g.110413 m.110413 type:complete len:486 (+) comp13403_c0_seq1:291-1748(+)
MLVCGTESGTIYGVVALVIALLSLIATQGAMQRTEGLISLTSGITAATQHLLVCSVVVVCWWLFSYGISSINTNAMNPLFFQSNITKAQYFVGDNTYALQTGDVCVYGGVVESLARAFFVALTVVGAGAERLTLLASMVIAFWVGCLVFPFIHHWTGHSTSWLPLRGSLDIHGNASMMLVIGVCGLFVSLSAGLRPTKFINKETILFGSLSSPRAVMSGTMKQILGGIFMLVIAPAVITPTFTLRTITDERVAGIFTGATAIVVSASVAAAVAQLTHIMTQRRAPSPHPPQFHLQVLTSGALAGMVAVSGAAPQCWPELAAVVGAIAGVSSRLVSHKLLRSRVDDANDSVSVFLCGSLISILVSPFTNHVDGIFYKQGQWAGLGWTICSAIITFAWCLILLLPVIMVLQHFGLWRIEDEILNDTRGLDFALYQTRALFRDNSSTSTVRGTEFDDVASRTGPASPQGKGLGKANIRVQPILEEESV